MVENNGPRPGRRSEAGEQDGSLCIDRFSPPSDVTDFETVRCQGRRLHLLAGHHVSDAPEQEAENGKESETRHDGGCGSGHGGAEFGEAHDVILPDPESIDSAGRFRCRFP